MNLNALFLSNFLFFLISLDSVCGQGICFNDGFFKPNSTYDLNRRLVLSSLASNVTAHNGFLNSSMGQNGNRVFILSMCIPGSQPNLCSECLEGSASVLLLRDCHNQTEAYTWPGCCMARYSNTSFSGAPLMEPSRVLPHPKDIGAIVSNFTEFHRIWTELMVRTIHATASLSNHGSLSSKHKYYAAEVASLPEFQTLYAMMQCTPDVSSRECEVCLKKNVDDFDSCCSDKQGGAVVRPICFMRWDMYGFAGAFENTTFPPPPPQSLPSLSPPVSERANTTSKDGKSISTGATVAIVVPAIFILALLVVGFTVWRRKRSYKTTEVQAGGEITTHSLEFSFKNIEAATDNFSDSNMIGRGGFGEVYRGKLLSGTEVAVKRLSKTSVQGAQEFKNEAVLVAKLQHKNLVRLLGFCLEGEEKILVYEFVPNKSLDYFLFDPKKKGKLDWKRRYKIIVGIARGILYLHQDSRLTIIHRDLKASNILLDAHMNPKIADFGMARIIGIDQTQVNTRRIVGTYGYMPPEYAMRGHFSVKSDVYSFGVMILEIICGKKNSSFYNIDDSAGNLVTHAWTLWRNESPFKLVDPRIGDSYQSIEVRRCIHIALLCVQENPADRPVLPMIIVMLTSSTISLPVPRTPGFCLQGQRDSPSQSTSTSIPASINDVTITDLDPR